MPGAGNRATTYPELSEHDKQTLMRHIKCIVQLYDETVAANDTEDMSQHYRTNYPNSRYERTSSGLYLACYAGKPTRIWTPWGTWTFAVTNARTVNSSAFMSKLRLEECAFGRDESNPLVGPLYKILAIEGKPLPAPMLVTNQLSDTDCDALRAEWLRLYEAV